LAKYYIVFLASDETVKLGDFGLSKFLGGPHDYTSTFVGTPLYMAPEMCATKIYTT
jgi:serine/threonine protein kinase